MAEAAVMKVVTTGAAGTHQEQETTGSATSSSTVMMDGSFEKPPKLQQQQQQQQHQHQQQLSPHPNQRIRRKLSTSSTPATCASSSSSSSYSFLSSSAGSSPATAATANSSSSCSMDISSDTIDVTITNSNSNNSSNNNNNINNCSNNSSNSSNSFLLRRHQQQQQQQHQHQQSLVRLPMPSPSRPRLHPRYAARLAPMMVRRSTIAATTTTKHPSSGSSEAATSSSSAVTSTNDNNDNNNNNSNSNNNSNDDTATATATASDTHHITPPPGITRDRDASIFRPTPIITCCNPNNDKSTSAMPMDFTLDGTPRTYSSNSSFDSLSNLLPPQNNNRPSSVVSGSSSGTRISNHHRTPPTSSSSSSSVVDSNNIGVSDRFIPSRATSSFNFNLWDGVTTPRNYSNGGRHSSRGGGGGDQAGRGGTSSSNHHQHNDTTGGGDDDADDNASNPTTTAAQSQQNLLNTLLRSELLGENESPPVSSSSHSVPGHHYSSRSSSASSHNPNAPLRDTSGVNNLRYTSPRHVFQTNLFEGGGGGGDTGNASYNSMMNGPTAVVNSFSLMPVGSAASQRLMAAPPKKVRRISKVPFKVLDAPALQDDFYLNLVDWSSQNVLAVGLGSCVYLWSACTSKVTKLCDLASSEDIVTSVSWAQRGTHLAVGTNRGEVQLWDTIKCKKVRSMTGHSARVGTLAWTGPVLASGSRDRLIFLRDLRVQTSFTDKLSNHKQEVCGLKWSYDEPAFLASGGNDNHLHVIDSRNPGQGPIHQFTDHTAAVKAIAWSPHQHGLLASGGGTADRCIRFWNTLSGVGLNKIDTGSQVCNLAWSQNCNEIVSTHGYSLNQIVIWRYPSMSKVATLTGHTYRVLYLSMSPDGSTIVTGAGDETLRFWQVFPGPRADGKESTGGLLFPKTLGSVIR